ncbi:MAG: inositol monophosphatase, partial [Candidatus Thiodiazotropha sp. (ex Lucinoma borealis)]|nr:inositol monophosphatase [Candidatus Thiodiazotropha sp. (ex Lucinoma borealis)]
DPISDEMFTASRGEGALLNDRKIRVSGRKSLEGALLGTGLPYRDFSFTDNYLGMLKDLMKDSAGVRRPGSAALDFAFLAAGRTDGFWELGLSEWDFAAGAVLVREAGGLVTDIGGGERFLDTGNVIAGNIKVHNAMLKRILPHLDDKLTA